MNAVLPVPAPAEAEERRGLTYPHGRWVPAPGTLAEVAPGVFWQRMPLPFSLDHINLYVLDGGDHWAVVDTGLNGGQPFWTQLFEGPLAGKPVGRVIVTHYHPDHLGLAGWLCRRWGVPLEMTRAEYLLARVLTLDVADRPPEDVIDFYVRAGWPEDAIERLRTRNWGNFARGLTRLPTGYKRLREDDVLAIGRREWRIVTGAGHSPEHACLVCEEDGLMIAGDQVLPRITSNVSVYPSEPDADPLGDWLDSIDKLRTLPDTLRVLPAHGSPFDGLHARLDQLAADHHAKLDALEAFCAEPRSAHDCFGTLFRREVGPDEIMMATGETLAHLHWLERRGRVRRIEGEATHFVRA